MKYQFLETGKIFLTKEYISNEDIKDFKYLSHNIHLLTNQATTKDVGTKRTKWFNPFSKYDKKEYPIFSINNKISFAFINSEGIHRFIQYQTRSEQDLNKYLENIEDSYQKHDENRPFMQIRYSFFESDEEIHRHLSNNLRLASTLAVNEDIDYALNEYTKIVSDPIELKERILGNLPQNLKNIANYIFEKIRNDYSNNDKKPCLYFLIPDLDKDEKLFLLDFLLLKLTPFFGLLTYSFDIISKFKINIHLLNKSEYDSFVKENQNNLFSDYLEFLSIQDYKVYDCGILKSDNSDNLKQIPEHNILYNERFSKYIDQGIPLEDVREIIYCLIKGKEVELSIISRNLNYFDFDDIQDLLHYFPYIRKLFGRDLNNFEKYISSICNQNISAFFNQLFNINNENLILDNIELIRRAITSSLFYTSKNDLLSCINKDDLSDRLLISYLFNPTLPILSSGIKDNYDLSRPFYYEHLNTRDNLSQIKRVMSLLLENGNFNFLTKINKEINQQSNFNSKEFIKNIILENYQRWEKDKTLEIYEIYNFLDQELFTRVYQYLISNEADIKNNQLLFNRINRLFTHDYLNNYFISKIVNNNNDGFRDFVLKYALIALDKKIDCPVGIISFFKLRDKYPNYIFNILSHENSYLLDKVIIDHIDRNDFEKYIEQICHDFSLLYYLYIKTNKEFITVIKNKKYAGNYKKFFNKKTNNERIQKYIKNISGINNDLIIIKEHYKYLYDYFNSFSTNGDYSSIANRFNQQINKLYQTMSPVGNLINTLILNYSSIDENFLLAIYKSPFIKAYFKNNEQYISGINTYKNKFPSNIKSIKEINSIVEDYLQKKSNKGEVLNDTLPILNIVCFELIDDKKDYLDFVLTIFYEITLEHVSNQGKFVWFDLLCEKIEKYFEMTGLNNLPEEYKDIQKHYFDIKNYIFNTDTVI